MHVKLHCVFHLGNIVNVLQLVMCVPLVVVCPGPVLDGVLVLFF